MNILLLSQFFWPEKRTAPINLASMVADLTEKGHHVQVITGFPNHPFGKIYDGYRQKLWQWDEYKEVPVLRLPIFPDHSKSLFWRLLNFTSFSLSASIIGLILTRKFRPDVLFVYFAPITISWVAQWYKTLFRVPIVYWVTDLWLENLKAANFNMPESALKVMHQMEEWSYNKASCICVDSPGFRLNLLNKGVSDEKIQVVSEWAEEDLFYPIKYDVELAIQYKLNNRFNIIYGGNLGTVQALDTVIEAAKKLTDLPLVQFVFIGDGNEEKTLKNLAFEQKLSNILFIPRQPIENIHRFFALADVLLVHLKNEPIFKLQLPSKILAYMACGQPILCGMSGSAEEIVLDAGAGLSCTSENPEAMADLARCFYNMKYEERKAMGMRARKAYLQNHTRSVQVTRIESILHSVIQSSDQTRPLI